MQRAPPYHLPQARLGIQCGRMATAPQRDLLSTEEPEPPLRPLAPTYPPPPLTQSAPPTRPPARRAAGSASSAVRRVGLFLKILLGDMTIWAVLSGVLT